MQLTFDTRGGYFGSNVGAFRARKVSKPAYFYDFVIIILDDEVHVSKKMWKTLKW